jgi:hypothetical protein
VSAGLHEERRPVTLVKQKSPVATHCGDIDDTFLLYSGLVSKKQKKREKTMTARESVTLPGSPLVNRIFLEYDFNKVGGEGNALVVETSMKPQDKQLDELLMSLDEIRTMAEKRIGSFDRIDIRFV